jgi:ATP-binding cassette subfamily B protein
MSGGGLTTYVLYSITISGALSGIAGLVGTFMSASGASERVFELLDRSVAAPLDVGMRLDGKDREGSGPTFRGGVHFEDVRFAYPSRPDDVVLRSINFKVEPGQRVALVGPSGGGKSTIMRLIAGMYRVDATSLGSGRILLDSSIDSCDVAPSFLHSVIASVDQEPALFNASVAENIAFARPEAPIEAVRAAARTAHALDFVEDLPEGMGTIVGERGVRLSGGQKQRVAIARALLADPTLLLLDEATSALDAESEALVQAGLESLMNGRTSIVAAHRLSTVQSADRVIVLDGGRIVAAGTHGDLLRSCDVYRRLVQHQLIASPTGASEFPAVNSLVGEGGEAAEGSTRPRSLDHAVGALPLHGGGGANLGRGPAPANGLAVDVVVE